jgi:hypothetical protein
MCFVCIWEQTAIISVYNFNWLFYNREGGCLLCGTSWVTVIEVNCGEQSGTEAGFLRVLRLSPVTIILSSPLIGFIYVLLLTGQTCEVWGPFRLSRIIGYKKHSSSVCKGLIHSTLCSWIILILCWHCTLQVMPTVPVLRRDICVHLWSFQ